ncbi:flagellar hook-basal body complex protein FliE [Microvirga guangxiensis]|uniref:Flagellar hook-basal body complex protein FliE n=1 Tax=Microvirga guangxiensis TaxID=549386 RepID=A0A1G5CVT6_9HYPH|nr:flagellar hook-basal body complex protein FliE [Microvirga guangxiensis]SCY06504.1 flagellar hook-basal body complex protein FliE [Microvirga guangxiensis]
MISAASSISSMIDRPSAVSSAATANVKSISGAPSNGVAQVSFLDTMTQVASSSIDMLKAGEAASIAGIQGKASVQQVAEAVMAAEQTLQTAIAIRDKVVAAYQEIARMAI